MNIYTDEHWLESKEFPFYTEHYHFYRDEIIETHSHEFMEVVYVVEGTGLHEYRGSSYPISTGDVLIIEPYIPHAYHADASHLSVVNVIFQPSLLESELHILTQFTSFIGFFYVEPFFRKQANFQDHLKLNQQEHIEMMIQLDKIAHEFSQKKMGYHVIIKHRLIELFVFLSRCFANREQPAWPPAHDEGTLFQDLSEFIRTHYAQPLTLEQAAQLCGMSQTSFATHFKQHFNQTFVSYRNGIRMQVAKDLLHQSDQKISSIAAQVGFNDLSFFNRMFKRETGLSPVQYRSQIQE